MAAIPVEDYVDLVEDAEENWWSCSKEDWLEAFSHHPKIGDLGSLKSKFADTADWAGKEQGDVTSASENILKELAELNAAYEQKFGYIFIVCATGKSAPEMLELMKSRLDNDADTEIEIAADEQLQITRLRLQKLLQVEN